MKPIDNTQAATDVTQCNINKHTEQPSLSGVSHGVNLALLDPTPSDYGTYHESSAKLLPKGMWKQERYEATLAARARSVPGLQLGNQPFPLTKSKDRSGLELNPTFPQ